MSVAFKNEEHLHASSHACETAETSWKYIIDIQSSPTVSDIMSDPDPKHLTLQN